jgi:hypothetical protein
MSKTFGFTLACAILGSSLASFSVQALPISSLDAHLGASDVTLVAGGCGAGRHRDGFGGCVPNGAVFVPAPVIVAPPVVCGVGLRWHPRFRRCVVL